MLKVFHIISHFELGGAEKVAINIAKSGNKEFEYHIVEVARGYSSFSEAMLKMLDEQGICYHRSAITLNKLAILFFPFRFLYLYFKYRPHIVHSHTEVPDLSVYFSFLLWRPIIRNCRIVRTIHNSQLWTHWNRVGRHVEHFLQRNGSNIAISIATQQSYYKKYGIECPIIYNGLSPIPAVKFENIKPDRINIVFAGRLEPQKGIDILTCIIKELRNNTKFFFHIIGDGHCKDIMLEQLKGYNNFRYYGKVYNLPAYLSSFDYLFMPSRHEGLALLAIEASLAGLPAIINACDGLEETLPDSWPYKVQNNSIAQYLSIFSSLDKQSSKKAGEVAFHFAVEHFSLSRMQTEYETLYKRL